MIVRKELFKEWSNSEKNEWRDLSRTFQNKVGLQKLQIIQFLQYKNFLIIGQITHDKEGITRVVIHYTIDTGGSITY
jgi:hypothetical protein